MLGNSRNQAGDVCWGASHKMSLYSQVFIPFYVFAVIFRSTKVVLVCSGLCLQQCHSNSGVCPDSMEFPRNVGHTGGREREWRRSSFFSPPSELYAFSVPLQKYYSNYQFEQPESP